MFFNYIKYFNKSQKQDHKAVPADQLVNETALKNSELKLEDLSVSVNEKNNEDFELNFNDLEVNIETAKDSKLSGSERGGEDSPGKKIQIEFSRVEDASKIMVTE